MQHSTAYRSRKETAENAPEPPVYERLPAPLAGSLTTFDRHNERVKLFGESPETLADPDAQEILARRFVNNDNYSKLTVFAHPGDQDKWERLGFRKEAHIGGYFRDGSDAEVYARYSDDERAEDHTNGEALEIALDKEPAAAPELPEGYTARIAGPDDVDAISDLLLDTFPEYPDDVSALALRPLVARRASIYILIEKEGQIACMAAAQINLGHSHAEISDCVTAEDHRGNGLILPAIHKLMKYVAHRKSITDFYSMARADVVAMNAALSRAGFTYGGKMVNDSRICDGLNSYNVWWRDARDLS